MFHCYGLCKLAVLATSSDHLPYTIITDNLGPAFRSSKTGTGAEAEDTQDLAGPAKAASQYLPSIFQVHYEWRKRAQRNKKKIEKINKALQSSIFTMVYRKISADMK